MNKQIKKRENLKFDKYRKHGAVVLLSWFVSFRTCCIIAAIAELWSYCCKEWLSYCCKRMCCEIVVLLRMRICGPIVANECVPVISLVHFSRVHI